MSIVRLFVLVAGRAVASHAVGLGLIGKGLVHRSNHRLGRVDLHVADVMAAAAGDEKQIEKREEMTIHF